MHGVRLPDIHNLLSIIYYIFPLPIVIVWLLKAAGLSKARQTPVSVVF